MEKVLELEHIYHRRNSFWLRDICLEINEGETVALSGRSGSGKTSLIRIITNVEAPTAGIVRYFGKELYEDEAAIRRDMSVVFDDVNFNTEYKAIKLAEELKKFDERFDMAIFQEYIDRLEIDPNKRIRQLSRGNSKKYMIALALARKPRLLIMDEPGSTVDDKSKEVLYGMIDEYRKESPLTILFSSHDLEEMNKKADRILVMEEGVLR